MKINEIKKKDGSTVYRANIYLGVDVITGKKVTTKVTARTKKELKTKAQQAQFDFKANGSTRFKASSITTYKELALLWWESYKDTVKPNTQDSVYKILNNHILPLFGSFKLDKLTTPLIQSIINKIANKTKIAPKEVKEIVVDYTVADFDHDLTIDFSDYGTEANATAKVSLRNLEKAPVKYFDKKDK